MNTSLTAHEQKSLRTILCSCWFLSALAIVAMLAANVVSGFFCLQIENLRWFYLALSYLMTVIFFWRMREIAVRALWGWHVYPESHEANLLGKIWLLSARLNIPTPSLWVAFRPRCINAQVAGGSPSRSAVVLYRRMLDIGCSEQELEGVLAHELGHVVCRTAFIQTVLFLLGCTLIFQVDSSLLEDFFWNRFKLLSLAFAVIVIAMCFVARAHERGCDRISVLLTGHGGMADALLRWGCYDYEGELRQEFRGEADLLKLDLKRVDLSRRWYWMPITVWSWVFWTHPSVTYRVRKIQRLARGNLQ